MRMWNDGKQRLARAVRAACCAALVASCGAAFAGDAAPGLSEAEFGRLYGELELKGGMWDVDWQVSLTDARRLAAKEGKPIFMVVNTGNCLGFV